MRSKAPVRRKVWAEISLLSALPAIWSRKDRLYCIWPRSRAVPARRNSMHGLPSIDPGRTIDWGNRGNMMRAVAFNDPDGPARWGLADGAIKL